MFNKFSEGAFGSISEHTAKILVPCGILTARFFMNPLYYPGGCTT